MKILFALLVEVATSYSLIAVRLVQFYLLQLVSDVENTYCTCMHDSEK